MAANLTPQYLKAEEEYRRAQNTADELHWLEVMYREIPKHKASEKLQSERQRVAAPTPSFETLLNMFTSPTKE